MIDPWLPRLWLLSDFRLRLKQHRHTAKTKAVTAPITELADVETKLSSKATTHLIPTALHNSRTPS